jgi:hypothetical protein
MKFLIIVATWFLVSFHSILARSEMSQARYACNMIELAIWDEFVSQGKPLPSSWDDITSFREMKKNMSTQSINTLRHINAFALVPNAPVIHAEAGISRNISDRRLFAIGRIAEFHLPSAKSNDETTQQGRYVILVTVNGDKTDSCWVLESEVQLILKQINDLDLNKQQLAFDDLDSFELARREAQNRSVQEIQQHQKIVEKHESNASPLRDEPKSDNSKDYVNWIVSGWIILILVVCSVLYYRIHPPGRE